MRIFFKKIWTNKKLKFVAYFGLFVVGLFLLIFIASILIDPWGQIGTGLLRPLVLTNRVEKLGVLAKKDPIPEIIIFGSSRVFQMNPDLIENEVGMKTYNASVSYARPEEYNAMAKYIIEDLHIKPNIFIVGFNIGEFNDDDIYEQTVMNPNLRKKIGITKTRIILTLLKIFKKTITPQYIYDLYRSISRQTNENTQTQVAFDENGYQIFNKNDDFFKQKNNSARTIVAAIDLFDSTDEPTKFRKMQFENFLKFSLENGVRVIAINLPMPESVISILSTSTNYENFKKIFDKFIVELQTKYNFDYFDFSLVNKFNGYTDGFNDSTHPDYRNLDKIVKNIFEDKKLIIKIKK